MGLERQHTVPCFHLRGSAENGHVVVLAPGGARRLGVKVASVEPDIYAVRKPDGSLYRGFERRFAEIERRAAGPLPDPRERAVAER